MTFAPNRTDGEPDLTPTEYLKYMPTYESYRGSDVVQMFISEDFINSIFGSFAYNRRLDILLVENDDGFFGTSCYDLARTIFKNPNVMSSCMVNLYLGKHYLKQQLILRYRELRPN